MRTGRALRSVLEPRCRQLPVRRELLRVVRRQGRVRQRIGSTGPPDPRGRSARRRDLLPGRDAGQADRAR